LRKEAARGLPSKHLSGRLLDLKWRTSLTLLVREGLTEALAAALLLAF
jgi:hypothetical protein